MRNPIILTIATVLLALTRTSFGGCTAPSDETAAACISCGNLEQNVSRGLDLAWNEYLKNLTMQMELRAFGATLVHLTNPPHSSPGVLYYTVLIEDPQFEITNIESYAEAVQLMRSWGIGFTYAGANPRAEFVWRQSMTTRIENALSISVSTGSAPYIMRLLDSNGNLVAGGTIEQPRLTGEQMPSLAGPADLFPDDQYANDACVSEDPRAESGDAADAGGSGGGDYSDNSDFWEGWGDGYGDMQPMCRPDFSDPAGAGVICVI